MSLRYLSVCSGIEAATVAWHSLGWEPIGFAEIEPFPARVLAHHYPDIPNYGDLTNYKEWPIEPAGRAGRSLVDVLVGGTPCQSFSVAGLRLGLADARGNLALTFLGCVKRYRPRCVVWENVPGVLSSTSLDEECPPPPPPPMDMECEGETVETSEIYDGGESQAFGCFLSGLEELGYEWSYRVLDAQYFGVPQRRRRVFVVASPRGSGVHPAEVLFEPEGLCGDLTPSRETGESIAGSLSARSQGGGGLGTDFEVDGGLVPAHTTGDGYWREGFGTLRGREQDSHENEVVAFETRFARNGRGAPSDVVPPLKAQSGETGKGDGAACVAFSNCGGDTNLGISETGEAPPVTARNGDPVMVAFSCKDSGDDANSVTSPTLRSMNDSGSHANGGGQVAVAFDTTQITSDVNRSNPQPGDPCHPVSKTAHPPALAISARARGDDGRGYDRPEQLSDQAGALDTVKPDRVFTPGSQVRRLTPRECERLQGFPDDYTLLPEAAYDGYGKARTPEDRADTVRWLIEEGWSPEYAEAMADHPDGPRYKALGNSMAVPVMRWIGERITQVLTE